MERSRLVAAKLDQHTGRILNIISAEEEISIRSLIAEALYDLILKRGKTPSPELVKAARKAA